MGGKDTITGGAGNDTINGGAGNDLVIWNNGDASDTVDGGADTDTLEVNGSNTAPDAFVITNTKLERTNLVPFTISFSNIERIEINGLDGDDDINASGLTNTTTTLTVNGGDGFDTIIGGSGKDMITGGSGKDTLIGGGGDDIINGDAGDDLIIWNNGDNSDTVDGGDDTDLLQINGSTGATGDIFTLNNTQFARTNLVPFMIDFSNVEMIQINGLDGDDNINASGLTNTAITLMVFGGAGNDTIAGGVGNDTLDGGLGNDTLSYANAASSVTVDLSITSKQNIFGAVEETTISNFENLTGSGFDDTLTGDAGDNILNGGNGNDTLNGGGGNDTLNGGAGNDTIVLSGNSSDYTITPGMGGLQIVDNRSGSPDGTDLLSDIEFFQFADGKVSINFGTNGDNEIDGTDNTDIINALAGDDEIDAGGGSDTVLAGEGDDEIDGGSGNDTLSGEDGDDLIDGGSGNDILVGGDGLDILNGGSGNDTLTGGAGNDVIDGGSGNDTVVLTGNRSDYKVSFTNGVYTITDTRSGSPDGTDSVINVENFTFADGTFTDILAPTVINIEDGDADNTVIVNTALTYTITFSEDINAATLASADFSNAGTATINIGAITETSPGVFTVVITPTTTGTLQLQIPTGVVISDVAGNNLVVPLVDDQVITVNLNGGPGDDIINGGPANDIILGGDGDDIVNGGAGDDSLTGGNGDDQLNGGSGNDILIGEAGTDFLNGGSGNDILEGGADNDILDGGSGMDTMRAIATGTNPVTFSLTNTSFTGTGLGTDTLTNIEQAILTGGTANDIIDASKFTLGSATLIGGGGKDTLRGGSSNDLLEGGAGNDSLFGNAGTDTVIAQGDNDFQLTNTALTQGTLFKANATNSGLTGLTGAARIVVDNDTLSSIEQANLTAGVGNNFISTTGFSLGSVVVDGGDGNDFIFTGTKNDTLIGGLGNDFLSAGSGEDILDGGADNDVLIGGLGNDKLTGGVGSDRFVFDTNAIFSTSTIGKDTITDFNPTEDLIVLDRTTFTAFVASAASGNAASGGTTIAGADLAVLDTGTAATAGASIAAIVYIQDTGALFYNQNRGSTSGTNGLGSGGQFATLPTGLTEAQLEASILIVL